GFCPVAVYIAVLGGTPAPDTGPVELFRMTVALLFALAASRVVTRPSRLVKFMVTCDDEITVFGENENGTAAIAISGAVITAVTIHHLCFENLLIGRLRSVGLAFSCAPHAVVPVVDVPAGAAGAGAAAGTAGAGRSAGAAV